MRGLPIIFCLVLLTIAPSACKKEPPAPTKARGAAGGAARGGSRAAAAPASMPAFRLKTFADARLALVYLLKRRRPKVLGFGEYHQKKGGAKVASSIKRFAEQLLPVLAPHASDLVVETWVTTGDCGNVERRVVRQVQKTTKRPQATESEVIRLIKRADSLGVKPHILRVACKDYRALLGGKTVDYGKLLKLTGDRLGRKIDEVRRYRRQKKVRASKGTILVYGGGMHNDLQPRQEFAAFSYAPKLDRALGGDYLEVDLYVPEYIERASSLVSEERWFSAFQRRQSVSHALLIERSDRSYIIVFRRTLRRKKNVPSSR